MATLQEQLARVQKVTSQNITNVIFDFLRSIENELSQLNRDQLFKSSTDIFGQPLGTYSQATEYITTNDALLGKGTKIKKAGDPYDFDQTGTFLNSIFAKASDNIISFGASDPKLDEILGNVRLLSREFFGLTDEHKKQVIFNEVLPFFQKAIRKDLKL